MNVNRNGIMWMSERNRNKFTFDFKIAKKKSNGFDTIIPICERYVLRTYVRRRRRMHRDSVWSHSVRSSAHVQRMYDFSSSSRTQRLHMITRYYIKSGRYNHQSVCVCVCARVCRCACEAHMCVAALLMQMCKRASRKETACIPYWRRLLLLLTVMRGGAAHASLYYYYHYVSFSLFAFPLYYITQPNTLTLINGTV